VKALVIGAGIGGLGAAIALRRAAIDVEVFERVDAIREVGAGVSLWANAIQALNALGLADALRSNSIPYDVGGLRSADGAVLSSISTSDLVRLFGVPVIVMHRADLVAALLSAYEAPVRLGMACTGFTQDPDGVTVTFAGGRTARGDLLVGADGLHSVVRAAIHGDVKPRYSGCTAWRSVVGFDGELRASETWGSGRVFGQVPISGQRVYWYAARNAVEGERSHRPKAELLALFKGWHEPIEALIDAAEESTILRNDLYDRPPLTSWGTGRVTLLGDAAHPMMPFLGQGACQALEDAMVLGRSLARLPAAIGVEQALRDYEARRVPRANAVVSRSRDIGRLARLRNPVAVAVRNTILRSISPHVQARQLARLVQLPPDRPA